MVVDLGGKKQVIAVIVTSWSSGVCLLGFLCFFGEGWGGGLRKIFFSTNLSENLDY